MEEKNEIMLDLLSKQAVYGLTEEETRQLGQLDTGNFGAESFEMTATAIALIDLKAEQMPEHLFAKVAAAADEFWTKNLAVANFEEPETQHRTFEAAGIKPHVSFMDWFGWAVAAAACIALAVNIYSTRTQPNVAVQNPTPTPTQEEKLDPSQQRQRFVNAPGQVLRIDFAKGNVKEISDISGDVVWSDAKQVGYLRIKGLPKNDITKETYQIWIFDETQDKETPIDGGTFDINTDGETIIPIDARLNAKNPALFAITIEKPGGVVVSKRGRIAALAAVKLNQS